MTHTAGVVAVPHRLEPWGMTLFVVFQGVIFAGCLLAYLCATASEPAWSGVRPDLPLACVMLVLLVSCSGLLCAGRTALERGAWGRARWCTAAAIAVGVTFFVLQVTASAHAAPSAANAQATAFCAITCFHGAHVALGLLMLGYVLLPHPTVGAVRDTLRDGLNSAAVYWHFLAVAWGCVIVCLYT